MMTMLRICSTYHDSVDLDSPALVSVKFVQQEVYALPNASYEYQREDQIEGCIERIARNETDVMTTWGSLRDYWPHVKDRI